MAFVFKIHKNIVSVEVDEWLLASYTADGFLVNCQQHPESLGRSKLEIENALASCLVELQRIFPDFPRAAVAVNVKI